MIGSSSTIFAVGAAGKFAGLVVPALAARGGNVRGLVRDGAKADAAKANDAVNQLNATVADLQKPPPAAAKKK